MRRDRIARMLVVVAIAAAPTSPAWADPYEAPAALLAEHEHIRSAVAGAAREPGKLGAAARSLQAVLEPHLVEEELTALPPLALLVPLSRGEVAADRESAIKSTAKLQARLPELIKDHARIAVAAATLRQAAWSTGRSDYAELADAIMRHARIEEAILYPAALVVGRAIRPGIRPSAATR
jgi:hypothetical protein